MSVIRIKHSDFEMKYRVPDCADTLNTEEWAKEDANRVKEAGWESRYEYEAQLILSFLNHKLHYYDTILEIGPGPGVLSEKLQSKMYFEARDFVVQYDLVDKPYAKEAFEKAKRFGRFLVKDISNGLDLADLKDKYRVVICNDTLEHLFNPSDVVQKVHKLLADDGFFFVSVPNWRMGHQFVYRGLFDYDNFLFFMRAHHFEPIAVSPSPLQTPDYPRLSSEEEMDEELRRSWNWYFTFQKEK